MQNINEYRQYLLLLSRRREPGGTGSNSVCWICKKRDRGSFFHSFAISVCLVACVFVAAATLPATAQESPSLHALLSDARRGRHYVAPRAKGLEQARKLFVRTLLARDGHEDLRDAWAKLRFEMISCQPVDEPLIIVREAPGYQSGRGFFAFRAKADDFIALQAPHSSFDRFTGGIAAKLFLEGRVAAGAWNTVHRSTRDLAHTHDHYLNAFTQAFVAAHPRGLVIQLHGFAHQRRETAAAATADMIVSNGTRYPQTWVQRATDLLRHGFPQDVVRLYPLDVLELGGTTNTQGKLVRATGADGFLHLEMSLRLRRRLYGDRSARADFLKNLSSVYRTRLK